MVEIIRLNAVLKSKYVALVVSVVSSSVRG